MFLKKALSSFLSAPPAKQAAILSLAVALVSAGALAFAYTAQYGFGLQPCILCLYQRWPYRIAIALGLIALFFRRSEILWPVVLLYVAGAAIAFFQVGVEEHWWRGTSGCSGPVLNGLSVQEMMAAIDTAPVVPCDQVAFRFLGLSMAAYNGLLSAGLAVVLAVALWAVKARPQLRPT